MVDRIEGFLPINPVKNTDFLRYALIASLIVIFSSCSASAPKQAPLGGGDFTNHAFLGAATDQVSQHAQAASGEVSAPTMAGLASWYGPGFHGRRTSSGEVYNQHEMTAAHRSLPFNTRVRVTSVATGKSVVVRINDRGPFVETRLIDISLAAAASLGIVRKGVTQVELELLDKSLAHWPEAQYSVQLAAFAEEERAHRRIEQLLSDKPISGPLYVREPGRKSPTYRVRMGPYEGYSVAKRHAAELRRAGLAPLVVEESSPPEQVYTPRPSQNRSVAQSKAAAGSRAALQSASLPQQDRDGEEWIEELEEYVVESTPPSTGL